MGHDVVGHEVNVAKSLRQNVVVNGGGGSGAGRRESSPDSSPNCRHFFHPRHASKLSSIFFQSELFYSPLLFLERFDQTIPTSSPLFMGFMTLRPIFTFNNRRGAAALRQQARLPAK